jgi:hypothetical protein
MSIAHQAPRPAVRTAGRALVAVAISWLAAAVAPAQSLPNRSDPFQPVAFLIGRWEGTSEGQPGKGTLRREYERVLNGRSGPFSLGAHRDNRGGQFTNPATLRPAWRSPSTSVASPPGSSRRPVFR